MTVCTDVYVRTQSCGAVSIYPSQVHPSGGGGVRPGGVVTRRERVPLSKKIYEDEEALALALLLLS